MQLCFLHQGVLCHCPFLLDLFLIDLRGIVSCSHEGIMTDRLLSSR